MRYIFQTKKQQQLSFLVDRKKRILKFRKIHREKYGANLIRQEKQEIKIEEKKQIQKKKNRVSAANNRASTKLKISTLQNKVLELQKTIEDLIKKQYICSHCSNSSNSHSFEDNEYDSNQLPIPEIGTIYVDPFSDFSQMETDSQFDFGLPN